MLIGKELEHLFHQLIQNDQAQLSIGTSDIAVRTFDHASKLSLTTPIYFGGNYIPHNVRLGVKKAPPFEKSQTIRTTLSIDEEHFRIFFSFIGATDLLNSQKFTKLIEEFCHLAEEWRIYLDEHEKDDLIYIYQS